MSLENEQGTVAWFSLMSTAAKPSGDYYRNVFGWSQRDIEVPGMGKAGVWSAADCDFGGPVELDEKYGIPSHWICYFAVADVDASCKKLAALGGTVCYQPFDMPEFGRSAVVEDPQGNVFHLFTPLNTAGSISVMGTAAGQPCWLELMVDDLPAAQQFYGELLGWEFEPHEGAEEPYVMAGNAQGPVAGIMHKPAEMNMLPPAWLPYFLVEDLAAGMERAANNGGRHMFGPAQVPGIGELALYQDPAGAFAYLFKAAARAE